MSFSCPICACAYWGTWWEDTSVSTGHCKECDFTWPRTELEDAKLGILLPVYDEILEEIDKLKDKVQQLAIYLARVMMTDRCNKPLPGGRFACNRLKSHDGHCVSSVFAEAFDNADATSRELDRISEDKSKKASSSD